MTKIAEYTNFYTKLFLVLSLLPTRYFRTICSCSLQRDTAGLSNYQLSSICTQIGATAMHIINITINLSHQPGPYARHCMNSHQKKTIPAPKCLSRIFVLSWLVKKELKFCKTLIETGVSPEIIHRWTNQMDLRWTSLSHHERETGGLKKHTQSERETERARERHTYPQMDAKVDLFEYLHFIQRTFLTDYFSLSSILCAFHMQKLSVSLHRMFY